MNETETRAALVAEARRWLGTPFQPHQAVRGVGADCVQFALAIYKAVGHLPESTELPTYRLGQGDHLDSSIVKVWLSQSPYFAPEEGWPQPGSLLTMRVGRVEHHVGIMVTHQTFIHSMRRYGVAELSLKDSTFLGKLRTTWRPVCLATATT